MSRKRLAACFIVAVVLTLSFMADSGPLMVRGFSGSGSEADPYVITTAAQLQEVNDDLDAWYVLGNDVDASETSGWNDGLGFDPLGDSTTKFTGHFDGQDYVIHNLHINRPLENRVGLFGHVDSGADIKNVGLTDVNGSGTDVGGFAGYNYGTISSCYSTGSVSGSSDVGGFAGLNEGWITRCYWDKDTSGMATSSGGVGKTTAEMKQQATFIGWDFTSTWCIGGGVTYPHLRGMPAQMTASATGSGNALFDVDDSYALADLSAVAEADLPPEGKPNKVFPHGFFSFKIIGFTAGDAVTVTITLPSAVPVGTQYWKYGPTPTDPTDHWYQLPMDDDDGDNVIIITLVDGGLGDDDLTADSVIVDQGGPGNPPPAQVGGGVFTIDKLAILTPYIIVMALATSTAIIIKRRHFQ